MAVRGKVRPNQNIMSIYDSWPNAYDREAEIEALANDAKKLVDGLQRAINALDEVPEFTTREGINSYDLMRELEQALQCPPLALWARHRGQV